MCALAARLTLLDYRSWFHGSAAMAIFSQVVERVGFGTISVRSLGMFGLLAASIGLLMAPSITRGAPEPSPVPKRWQLDVDMGPLRVATIETENGIPGVYYYLTYTVTNNAGEDLLFAPKFELGTDEGEIIRSGEAVPAAATKEILSRLRNPLLEDQIRILGMLLQGEENAKDGLVVWPATDLDIDELTIYAAGFSGEMTTIQIANSQGQQVQKVLRKTQMMRHIVPGEIDTGSSTPLARLRSQWIMR